MIPRLLLTIEGYVLLVGVVRGRLLLDLEAWLVLQEDLELEEARVILLLFVQGQVRFVPLQAFGFRDLDMNPLHPLEGFERYGECGGTFKVFLLLKHPELPARLIDSQLVLSLRGLPKDQVFDHVAVAHPWLVLLEVTFFGNFYERLTGHVIGLGQGVLIEGRRRGVHQDLTLVGGRRPAARDTQGIIPRDSRIGPSAKPRSLKLILHEFGR